ncbi:hypothetical protein M2408_000569 [Sphingobacterium sp. BIGb0165]|nr:hypothetical protein [Sphingobacterium sp. BIGb0165]
MYMYLDDILLKPPNRGIYNYKLVIIQFQQAKFYPVLSSCDDLCIFF